MIPSFYLIIVRNDESMNCFCGMVALFPAGTIVRDPHHRESLTAGFEPVQNLSSGSVE